MGNFSNKPLEQLRDSLAKGYVGLRMEQGVPLLDRDVNLLADLLSAVTRKIVTQYIGNGTAGSADGFRISEVAGENDFLIAPGTCLVGGTEVTLATPVKYTAQPVPVSGDPLAALTTPNNARRDTVYLDVWLDEIASTGPNPDESLKNLADVGVQTSVRLKPVFLVRVAQDTTEERPLPEPQLGHSHYALAKLLREPGNARITESMLTHRQVPVSQTGPRLAALERLLRPAFELPGSQISPRRGRPGDEVVLRGRNFGFVSRPVVTFGDEPVKDQDPATAERIVVRVPSMPPGRVKVEVTIDAGDDIVFVATSDDDFIVEAVPPAPAFGPPGGQMSPRRGTPGVDSVKLLGTNFNHPNLQVRFEEVVAANPIPNPEGTEILIAVPTGLAVGRRPTVTVSHDGGSATSTDTFTAE